MLYQIKKFPASLVCDTTSINIAKPTQPILAPTTIIIVTVYRLLMVRDKHLLAELLGNQLHLVIGETNTFVMGTKGCNSLLG